MDEPTPRDEPFRLLVDSIRDYAIFMLTPDGTVATWNRGAERINGYQAAEILGRHFSILYPPEAIAAGNPERELRLAAQDGRYEEEAWRVRKDGTRYWANAVVASVRDADGKLLGYGKVTRDMTERRQVLEDLQESEERLAATLESIGDAVMATDNRGVVTRFNSVAERLTGWNRAEALGRPIEEVFVIINEETRAPAANPVALVLREGRVVGLANHTALIARDGTEHPIADSGAPIRGLDGAIRGSVLVFRDVTEERAAERALRESEEKFRLLVASVRDYAIFMLDPQGQIASWNEGAARIKGYSPDEIVGRHFSTFYPEEDVRAGKPDRELVIAAREGRYEEEGWRVRKDGSQFWASVVITAVHDQEGKLRGFAKITRDFTDRRKAEETTRRLETEIAARRAAEAAEARIATSEEHLRQQREQLSVVLAGVADGITAQDTGGNLLFANDAAALACGFPSSEALLSAGPAEVFARFEAFDEAGDPFRWEQLPGRRALAGEVDPSATLRIRNKQTGNEWWSQIKARAVQDVNGTPYLAVNIWRDVTEQRRRERDAAFLADATAILSSGLDYEVALDQLTKLSVPRLADWCAVDVPWQGALRSIAVAHSDPSRLELARTLRERYPPDPDAPGGTANVIRTGRSELYEEIPDRLLVASAKDQEHLRLMRELRLHSAIVVPLVARGHTLGALTLVSAESRRRFGAADLALAEELGRRAGLAIDNSRLYREATDAVRARDEFLSIAGHELKTPLAAVLLQVGSLLRLLNKNEPVDRQRILERLEKATANGARLEKLIDELLDVSRITSGRLILEREELDLAGLAAEVVAHFGEEAARAKCVLSLNGPSPVRGRWDRMRIEQVVTNLVSNAIKYGAGKPVAVSVWTSEGRAQLEVRDEGIGIPAEHQSRIFGRFERAVSVRHYGGFGLGLWISRQIAEAHGGVIRVQSEPGVGSTFTLDLPCS